MKIFGALFAGIVLGALAMKLMTPVTIDTTSEPRDWAAQGVQQIQNSGDVEDQLKAAEDYYGKAVVLFLAGLIREVNGAQAPAQSAALADPIVKELPPQEAIASSESAALASVTSSQKKIPVQAKPVKVTEEDKALNNLIFHRKAPFAERMTPQVRKMQGRFEGNFRWEGKNNRGRVDHVAMDMMFTMVEGKLHGNISIILTNPEGNPYSRSTGDGENQTLRLVPNRQDQVYIEPAPGDFILFDISNPNRMSGPYYGPGGELMGRVEVWRK